MLALFLSHHFLMIKRRLEMSIEKFRKKIFLYWFFFWTKFEAFKDTLEFNLGPDKRFLKLSETRLAFSVEIPANYVFDNDVFAKLVENTEIIINHESITRKSSHLDNCVTNSVLNKINYDDSLLNTSLKTHGIFMARLVD